jgi:hypothetical protein
MSTIAEIVNEWFQGEPTAERQQNDRRRFLIADLQQREEAELRTAVDTVAASTEGSAP